MTITSGLKPVLGTAQETTSGTAKDFTGIPSWAKRITINFAGVSPSGTAHLLVQIGTSSGLETSGYVSSGSRLADGGSISVVSSTAGFLVALSAATYLLSGRMVLELLDAATNTWVASYAGKISTLQTVCGGGDKSLAGVLDRVRVTFSNGTDTFDAGSVNIMYE
jgi:hypothetical protein